VSATALSSTRASQLAFWTAFSDVAARASIAVPTPTPRNWRYLPIGTRRAKIVLAISLQHGWVECKLALFPKAPRADAGDHSGGLAHLIRDREVIESELGFDDLTWGHPTATRVYRRAPLAVGDPAFWPEAFDWLIGTAQRFTDVFGPRLAGPSPAAKRAAVLLSKIDPTTPASSQHRHRAAGPHDQAAAPDRAHGRSAPTADGAELTIESCFLSLAAWCDLAVRRGLFPAKHDLPNGAEWIALYSGEAEAVHRYAFGLWWGDLALSTTAAWVLLNPATGDTDGKPRPILTRCRHQSEAWGCTGLIIVNLFAYRAGKPKVLKELDEPRAVGSHNNTVLSQITSRCRHTIAAWGAGGNLFQRSTTVLEFLNNPQCLPKNGQHVSHNGEPFYPKGIRLDTAPVALPQPAASSACETHSSQPTETTSR